MIRLYLTGVQWGTDPIEQETPEGELVTGRQINLFDKESGILVSVPFSGEPLTDLIKELAQGLSVEQRRDVAAAFTGGIVIPRNGLQG